MFVPLLWGSQLRLNALPTRNRSKVITKKQNVKIWSNGPYIFLCHQQPETLFRLFSMQILHQSYSCDWLPHADSSTSLCCVSPSTGEVRPDPPHEDGVFRRPGARLHRALLLQLHRLQVARPVAFDGHEEGLHRPGQLANPHSLTQQPPRPLLLSNVCMCVRQHSTAPCLCSLQHGWLVFSFSRV